MLHWEIAWRLVKELGAAQPDGGLRWPDGVPTHYKVPGWSQWILDWSFNQIADEIPKDWALEVESPLEWEFEHFILEGHQDVTASSPDGLQVNGYDWKTGRVPVTAAEFNDQLLGYLVLNKMNFPDCQRGRQRIFQPRNIEDEGFPRVSTVEREGAQLDACVSSLVERVNDAISDWRSVDSGKEQCAWCPVGIQCPSIREDILHLKTTLTDEMLAKITKEPNNALLGDMVMIARTIARPAADAQEMLIERILAEGFVDAGNGARITVIEEGGSYHCTSPAEVLAGLISMAPIEVWAEALSYPTTRIKDVIAKVYDVKKAGKAAQTAKSIFDARLGPFFEQRKKRTLVFQ